MPPPDADRNVQQCFLDRLIDNEPESRVEPVPTRAQSMRMFKAAVRRDLEWLLNSTRTVTEVPESLVELRSSVYVYGLPDITTMDLDNPRDEVALLSALETAIAKFEPRLARVKVTARDKVTKKAPSLQFQIEGMLLVDPAPERVSFDTVLEVSRGSYEVKGD